MQHEKRSQSNCKMQLGVWRHCKLCHHVQDRALVGGEEAKPLKTFGLFMSGGQLNGLNKQLILSARSKSNED